MRHYDYLSNHDTERIFCVPPSEIDRNGDKEILAHSLGATLYMPAVREKIAEDIINRKNHGLKSVAICLEDAIGDRQVEEAEHSVTAHFIKIAEAVEKGVIQYDELPLLFIRVRNPQQMVRVADRLGYNTGLLTGFIFPKFSVINGGIYFEELSNINDKFKKKIYGMPILESSDIMYKESRTDSLGTIAQITDSFYDLVLNIRIGATDFSNIYGIRRGYDINIYSISVIRDCIGDIINRFARMEKPYVISGPVWEYFSGGDRILKPQLRETPFEESYGKSGHQIRKRMISEYIDGLIYEVVLDKANGLWGKTIIHPSHILPVQSLYAVTHEEYIDAKSIIDNSAGEIGVMKSSYTNKMNEIKTHANWANKVLLRTKIFGVLNEGKIFTDLFDK